MARALSIILVVILLAFGGCGLALYLAYGLGEGYPGRDHLAGLDAPAQVRWYENGLATIDAASEADAYRALGYHHGVDRTFEALLYRQVALGRLGEWFGRQALPMDALARALRLADHARAAYADLPAADRTLLDAYAAGVTAAFETRAARYDDDVVAFDLPLEPWAPWHALAVERLMAWIGIEHPPPDSLAARSDGVQAFWQADARLRAFLHLHGMGQSAAWTIEDSTGTALFQRLVYGASARPLYAEVQMQWPGGNTIVGATIPGLPVFVAGRAGQQAWSILPTSHVRYDHLVADTSVLRRHYGRLLDDDGNEHLTHYDLAGEDLALATARTAVRADSAGDDRRRTVVVLRWPGFQPTTDWPAWHALSTGTPQPFTLLQGDGVMLYRDGRTAVLRKPEGLYVLPRATLVTDAPWHPWLAQRLRARLADADLGVAPTDVFSDDVSAWAAAIAPSLVDVAASVPNPPAHTEEALTFLRNWDYAYDRTSIGASIFDTWARLYRRSTGVLPQPSAADTLARERRLRFDLLVQAVDTLTARFGADLRQWRWENVQPHVYYFPVWASDTTNARSLFAGGLRSRYAPVAVPGDGHPSTLSWGASRAGGRSPAPAVWEAWISTASWDRFLVRRRILDRRELLSRYRIPERPPDAVPMDTTARLRGRLILSPVE